MQIIIFYALCVCISILLLGILAVAWDMKKASCYYLLFFTTIIVNFFYMMLSASQDLRLAIFCNKMTCLDGTFMSFFLLLCICDICKIKVSKPFIIFMVILNLFVFYQLIASNPILPYYISAELHNEEGYTYLIKEFGATFYIYMTLVIVYMLAPIPIVIYALTKKKNVSFLFPILLGVCQLLVIALYIIEAILGLHIERLPIGYVLTEIVILWIMGHTARYDLGDNIREVLTSDDEHGYVLLDKHGRYKGSDEVARRFFPELNTLSVDRSVNDNFLRAEFSSWLHDSLNSNVDARQYIRDGRDVKVTARPFYNKRKKRIGFLVEVIDNTDTQNNIRHLKELNRVQRELTIKADAAARAKGNFLSMMSHEIRTPINAIMGMNEMIAKASDDPVIREYAQDVHSSVEWLLSLVNDVLDYSKLDSGNMKLVETSYKMSDILRQVEMLAAPLAQKKSLKLIIEESPSVPAVMRGDETKLKQVLINFVTNAVKYTDEGTITISVSYEDGILTMSVADTGRGIPEESIPILFDAFSRINEDKNVGIEGTGLGLAITRDFVKLMGGDIKVTSEFGKGSTFTVTLPQQVVLLKESEEEEGDASVLTANNDEIHDFNGLRILTVDDTLVNLKLFGLFLKDTGATVDTAKSGEIALELASSNKYDLMFIDHMMKGMDGPETLQTIRNSSSGLNKDTMAIVATANSIQDGGEEYRSMGFDDYLCKPYTSEQLLSFVSRCLNSLSTCK